jgi:NAD(P)-dependent dehydrogenase (short-subunit alcohol dehydrogenase family)
MSGPFHGPSAIAGRTALVTGAGRGIGAAVARALAGAGAEVAVVSRTLSEVEAVAKSLRADGAEAWAIVADVSQERGVATLAERAFGLMGNVDLLVHAAGMSAAAPLERLTLSDWNAMLASHATSAFLLTRAFVPTMRERGFGRIVHLASSAGLEGARYIAHYAAAKHAVVGFVRAVACELEGTNVTIHALCPGYVDTPMTRRTIENVVQKTGRSAGEALQAVLATAHQGRLLTADEVAKAACELLRQPGDVNGRIERMP